MLKSGIFPALSFAAPLKGLSNELVASAFLVETERARTGSADGQARRGSALRSVREVCESKAIVTDVGVVQLRERRLII